MGNYVCSDIHGLGQRYSDMIDKYGVSGNKIYIIGDAIDNRYPGEEGIQILFDIMERDNVELLMGNHELMFVETLNYFYTLVHQGNSEAQALRTCLQDSYVANWIISNNGAKTMNDYLALSPEKQKKLREFLKNLAVSKDIKVLNSEFYLVHAAPVKLNLQAGEETFYDYQGDTLRAEDLLKISRKALFDAVWTRYEEDEMVEKLILPKKNVIIGHTPTVDGKIKYYGKNHFCRLANVDCNCKNAYQFGGKPYTDSNLGVVCLEDIKKEDYFHDL